MILERGVGELENTTSYSIDARGLRVYSAAPRASARVRFDKDNRVLMPALNGPVRVTTSKGLLVANVAAGKTLVFDPQQAGAAAPTKVTGRLEKKEGRYLVTDETTNVTVELVGEGLEKYVGRRIEATGVIDPTAKPAAPASSSVKITQLKPLPAGWGRGGSRRRWLGGSVGGGQGGHYWRHWSGRLCWHRCGSRGFRGREKAGQPVRMAGSSGAIRAFAGRAVSLPSRKASTSCGRARPEIGPSPGDATAAGWRSGF